MLERDAGFLSVEECVLAHIEAARRLGADLRAYPADPGANGTTNP